MPVGVTVRLYWPGVEKNITIYKGWFAPAGSLFDPVIPISVFIQTIEIGRNARRLPTKGQGSDNICFAVSTATRPNFAGRI
jgi:hypothetical protein